METLIDAAKELQGTNIRIVLIGRGQEKINLQNRVAKYGLQNVTFFDPVEKKSIPTLLQYFDCLYMGAKQNILYQYGMSFNKVFDYMMSGNIVISAVNSSNNIVRESCCGISIIPENSNALIIVIKKIEKMDVKNRKIVSERGRRYIIKNNTYSVLSKQFIEQCSK